MKTKNLIYEMLTENTGTHFLDSGGKENRNWQRNQLKTIEDFESQKEEVYEFDFKDGEILRTVSIFHFLTNNLELDNICDEFNEIQNESNDWDFCGAFGVSQNAFDHIEAFWEVNILRNWNTYNGDSDLSQILQAADVEINDEQYVLIQIHNGADARGGYTDAKLFKRGEYCECLIHESLSEFKDSYEIEEDMKEGYIETFNDYLEGENKTYTLEQVKKRIEELSNHF